MAWTVSWPAAVVVVTRYQAGEISGQYPARRPLAPMRTPCLYDTLDVMRDHALAPGRRAQHSDADFCT